ncbi:hypothetical protein OSB04_031572 [Centaurea solstitialis]|uniref:Uncharacterized protein n=1 Tax=Centaurea solstitialis TaxID=347529 RepID=A0AA38SAZ8_9ASTR|nr:hypothetical protein OSB04_031572 [Centaurea solstitialis]
MFSKLFPNDDEYSKVLDEYAMFSMKTGPSEDLTSISKMGTMEPKNWWFLFCAERNWRAYAFIHSLKRNKLTTSHAYIHNNLRFCRVADLSLDEPDFENDLIIDN